ncbi:MAG: hypothetical protein K1X95_05190 [Acidimicrobiia bacterium]|nr:hypothetical protein [Acidimicrobiia bacterium]
MDTGGTAGGTLVVSRRFRGPPESGNGGYVCGLVAGHVDGDAEVSLRVPPPLDTPMRIVHDGDDVRLLDGEREVAHGRPAPARPPPTPGPPVPPPTRAEAVAASSHYPGHVTHIFPTCFTCGTAREPGDGLCIYCGAVAGSAGLVAAAWNPVPDLAGDDGRVRPEIVWAALDCPTYWALPGAGTVPAVLARLAVVLEGTRPRPGDDLVVTAWPRPEESEGRKHRSAAALHDATGAVLARSEALWIEIDPTRFA